MRRSPPPESAHHGKVPRLLRAMGERTEGRTGLSRRLERSNAACLNGRRGGLAAGGDTGFGAVVPAALEVVGPPRAERGPKDAAQGRGAVHRKLFRVWREARQQGHVTLHSLCRSRAVATSAPPQVTGPEVRVCRWGSLTANAPRSRFGPWGRLRRQDGENLRRIDRLDHVRVESRFLRQLEVGVPSVPGQGDKPHALEGRVRP